MAAYNVAKKAITKTLAGAAVDTVTMAVAWPFVEIVNHSAADTIWVTYTESGSAPPNPTVAGDDCEPVLPGERVSFINDRSAATAAIFKVLGNGGLYSVIGTRR